MISSAGKGEENNLQDNITLKNKRTRVVLSYFEIYLEESYDLLFKGDDKKVQHYIDILETKAPN